MDKFLYRYIFQTIIKGIAVTLITAISVIILYGIYDSALGPFGVLFDYWLINILVFLVTVVACFFIIFVKDDYKSQEVSTSYVGGIWVKLANKGVKVHWFWLRLLILPFLGLAIYSGYQVYANHEAILNLFREDFVNWPNGDWAFMDFMVTHYRHYLNIILAVFFLWQWYHLREFIKLGKCDKCGAAFALGYHSFAGVEKSDETKITKKARNVKVGEKRTITYMDGIEQSSQFNGNIYTTVNDYYKTDIHRETATTIYGCAICGIKQNRYDNHYIEATKKI